MVRNGVLRRVGVRTFAVGGLPPDHDRILLAACLDTGGVLARATAGSVLGLHGITRPRRPEVLVVRTGGRLSPVADVRTTTWLPADDVVTIDGLPCTSVARTLFDLAGQLPPLDLDLVRGAVDDAIRSGAASDAWLWWRLEQLRCRGRSGVARFESILQARSEGAVTESWLERELLRILSLAGIELPKCQARIAADGAFVARVDFLYERERIIVEVTGAVAHASAEQRSADARRRNHLARLGFLVLEFTYEQVVRAPSAVVHEIRSALAERRSGTSSVA